MKKLKLSPTLSHVGGMLTSLVLGTDTIVRRRWPTRGSAGLPDSEIVVDQMGDDFQGLWMEKLKEMPRLLADRSPAALRWHFETPTAAATAGVLGRRDNESL